MDILVILAIIGVVILLLILWRLLSWRHTIANLKQYSTARVEAMVPNSDFTFSKFELTTEDGYIIQLFNIRHRYRLSEFKNPVIFHHGFSDSGMIWLFQGRNNSPALVLASEG